MQRQNVIVLIQGENEPICRGNFKKLCNEFNLPYHSLKKLKFPIEYKGCIIYRTPFK